MARTLEALQKQYNSSSHKMPGGMKGPGGPGGPGGRGRAMGAKGKPKNTKQTILRLYSYVKPYTFHLILVLFFMLFYTLTSLVGGYMLNPIINKIAGRETTAEAGFLATAADNLIAGLGESMESFVVNTLGIEANLEIIAYLVAGITIMLSIYLLGIFATYMQQRILITVTQNSIENIRNELFEKLQKLPVKYFDANSTGEIMSRFTNDVDNISVMFDNSLTSLISGTVTLVGTFVFMITTSWILTLVTVFFIPIFTFGGGIIAKRSRKYYSSQQAALGALNGYIEESVSGQKVVKVFNHEEECIEEFELLNSDMREKQFNAQFFGGIMGPIMGNISQICYSVTIGVGGILMFTTSFTPGALTVFANYSKQFSMPINNISQQMTMVFSALAGAERVFAVMDMEPEKIRNEYSVDVEKMDGYVKFEDVSFGYNSDKKVLKNISLYAKPGQKIAFVGSTGAGKTTVTNLITRFYDINEGLITIDGIDIKKIPLDTLRSNIAVVLQDTHLFTGTVMENIRYGRPDATDEEVVAAAKTASAHSFIMRLENGYDTMLVGDGANLSQGQRQLLNIARAAISKAPILILDEATSSVDTRTERHIEHGMDRLMKNRTTFVIAHRLSTVRNSDAIMVIESGSIIERGTHEQLLDMKGRYYELYTGVKELS